MTSRDVNEVTQDLLKPIRGHWYLPIGYEVSLGNSIGMISQRWFHGGKEITFRRLAQEGDEGPREEEGRVF